MLKMLKRGSKTCCFTQNRDVLIDMRKSRVVSLHTNYCDLCVSNWSSRNWLPLVVVVVLAKSEIAATSCSLVASKKGKRLNWTRENKDRDTAIVVFDLMYWAITNELIAQKQGNYHCQIRKRNLMIRYW